MKILWLILISLFLFQVCAEPFSVDTTSSSTDIDGRALSKLPFPKKKLFNCGFACARRCREASRKKVCSRACKACCVRCHCVPPGTFGHTTACPCYAKLRTHGNKPKCP
ncbi:hypothetical protein V2J09_000640 [Rumex salicifolius]